MGKGKFGPGRKEVAGVRGGGVLGPFKERMTILLVESEDAYKLSF